MIKNQPTKEEILESIHPFPNKEIQLISKLNKESLISIEDIALISDLLHKYLDLRADVFHKL